VKRLRLLQWIDTGGKHISKGCWTTLSNKSFIYDTALDSISKSSAKTWCIFCSFFPVKNELVGRGVVCTVVEDKMREVDTAPITDNFGVWKSTTVKRIQSRRLGTQMTWRFKLDLSYG
jgi:hypothetical protein